jgi:hypothetical protein
VFFRQTHHHITSPNPADLARTSPFATSPEPFPGPATVELHPYAQIEELKLQPHSRCTAASQGGKAPLHASTATIPAAPAPGPDLHSVASAAFDLHSQPFASSLLLSSHNIPLIYPAPSLCNRNSSAAGM